MSDYIQTLRDDIKEYKHQIEYYQYRVNCLEKQKIKLVDCVKYCANALRIDQAIQTLEDVKKLEQTYET